jgi:hypothetical protein
MSRVSWNRRLRALESRPTAQRPITIIGGLPTGAEMLHRLAKASATAREPLCPAVADEAEHAPCESVPTESDGMINLEPSDWNHFSIDMRKHEILSVCETF